MLLLTRVLAGTIALALAAPVASARPRGQADDAPAAEPAVAVLAGGCFWGVEAVFERLRGVDDVVSGFSGGHGWTAHYPIVGLGVTNHAEAVRITYDPRQISYERLLDVFFAVAHDPTQLNRQGPDRGRQYRSAVFAVDEQQRAAATAYIARLNASGAFDAPVVTTVEPFAGFYPAGPEHQDFVVRHPTYPYVVVNDLPKLKALERQFPGLLRGDS